MDGVDLVSLKAHLDGLVRLARPPSGAAETDRRAMSDAVAAFLTAGPDLLAQATPHLRAYQRQIEADVPEEARVAFGWMSVGDDADIWEHVELSTSPSLAPGGRPLAPARGYLSFEGEVTWEREHGLQLVIAEGTRVCKVGPYDGHLTNASAYGDAALVDVVYFSGG